MTTHKRTLNLAAGILLSLPVSTLSPLLPAAAGIATVSLLTGKAQALPIDRAIGRQGARASRQTGRQVSRARRRGVYSLPAGYRPYSYGSYNYYFAGGRYYYPYMYGGRTVYINIEVSASGNPGPPPAPGSIDIDIY